MKIKIKGKELELNFGIRFIRECDKKAETKMVVSGVETKFSDGLAKYAGGLLTGNALDLLEVIDAALWKYKNDYTMTDLEDYLDDLDSEAYDNLYESVVNELKEANTSKKIMMRATQEIEKRKEMAETIQNQFTSK